MANDEKSLRAGFTGSPKDKPTGLKSQALSAVDTVKRETGSVRVGVEDHPHTASVLVLGIAALAFGLGVVVGRNSAYRRGPYWR
jgi:hypothetical protein